MKATNKTESDIFNKDTVPDSLFFLFFFTFTCTTAEFYIDDNDGDDFNLATCCRECGCCFKGV